MDTQPVDRVAILRESVQPLGETEVVVLGPAAAEILRISQRQTL